MHAVSRPGNVAACLVHHLCCAHDVSEVKLMHICTQCVSWQSFMRVWFFKASMYQSFKVYSHKVAA